MSSRLQFRSMKWVGAIALAAAGTLGLWRAAVWAELGLSNVINVEIEDPGDVELVVYTPGGDAPATLPVEITTEVGPEPARGVSTADIDSVETALGGTLNADIGEISDELDSVEATLRNEGEDESEYVSVVDLANLEYEAATRGEAPVLIGESIIRSVAIINGYYTDARTISDIVEGDAIEVAVEIRDSTDIDSDGNGIPDADVLLEGDVTIIGANGVITVVRNINGGDRGTDSNVVTQVYDSEFGPVEVTIESPTLADLQEADSDFDEFNEARLIVSIAGDAADLVDEPSGFDPVSEFDLTDGTDPLPAPQNVFVRATIAVANVSRGTTPTWEFVGSEDLPMPAGTEYLGELTGPGIAGALDEGTDVGAYSYTLVFEQDGSDIIATSDDTLSEWAEADDLSLDNEDNADDADARDLVTAAEGDDTIRATFTTGSAIFGSNVTPEAGSGGGGGRDGSDCFIASAAYGTPMAVEIQALRDVRDAYMVTNSFGAAFVDSYYRLSPPVARAVAEFPVLKQAVRVALTPVIWMCSSTGNAAAGALMMIAIGVALAGALRRRTQIS